jgi:arylsulfatase A-like enzyme
MPARREWLTGTQGFLWRPWGPLESFDTTLPERAREAGVLTKLITDHFHYFQYGSSGYYEGYHGFDFVRGHEDDAWKTSPYDPDPILLQQLGYDLDGDGSVDGGAVESGGTGNPATDPHNTREIRPRWSYARNVEGFEDEEDFFVQQVTTAVADWLRENRQWDQWFCYMDEFEVHEPFHCPEPYASMYTDEDPRDPELPLWPHYGRVEEGSAALTERELDFVRSQFAGKVTMTDRWLGRVFETMHEEDLWEDTVVVLTSDHGIFLGEHGFVGKPSAPDFDAIAATPLLVWHPDSPRMGEEVSALTSAVDVHATILDALGAPHPEETHSRSLWPLLEGEAEDHREWALYGWWGSSINVTDGEYTYHHPCDPAEPVECYSTQHLNPHAWMGPPSPPDGATGGQFLPYTEAPVWRYDADPDPAHEEPLLFERANDPAQTENLASEHPESGRMRELLVSAMGALDAPVSQFERFGLAPGR